LFYVVLTLIGMASRARLGIEAPKESGGLMLLNQDVMNLPIGSSLAAIIVAIISFGIFGALASTADNNLNIAAIGLSKLLFRRDWLRMQSESGVEGGPSVIEAEHRLLRKCRVLCLLVGFSSIATALLLRDIVAVMVNAAWIMMLFLPPTLGALLFGHHSKYGGLLSIVGGMLTYFAVLALGVPLKSAFLPGFVVSLTVYLVFIWLEKRSRFVSPELHSSAVRDSQ
jgi:Na+/proline symporter